MEVSVAKLKEVFKEMRSYWDDTKSSHITLKEFKKIVRDYDIELIKGQELSDADFHECCRQIFSQLWQKLNSTGKFTNGGLVPLGQKNRNNKSLGRTLGRGNFWLLVQ